MSEVPAWQAALFERRVLGVQLDLAAVRAAHAALGSPAAGIPALHVVGTNGKGSTAATAAHALRRRGRRVGLYTSPHLHRVGERIRVDGEAIADEELAGLVERVLAVEAGGGLPRPLTFFEVLTLAALLRFASAGLSAMVLEAGLGGRLDATRIVPFAATLLTPIALDHMAYLGPTVAAIAAEKAAVMEDGAPAFSAPQSAEAAAVLRATAARCGVPLTFVEPLARAPEGLPGAHQRVNAALALAGARVLEPAASAADLDGVRWPGRLERHALGGGTVLFDAAHNPHGVAALVEHLQANPARRAVLFGCLPDKDAPAMLAALATLGCPLWLAPPPGAAYPLAGLARPKARVFAGLEDPALDAARAALLAEGGEWVVCGSHHLVGHVRARLLGAAADARWLGDPLTRA
jgi:dihydrofolate synthase/folylpolyglutamate synthase